MVRGIESFRDWFYGYEDAYVLAGEAACDLLLGERGLDSGTVKELDLIPIGQEEDSPFRKRLADYTAAGEYPGSIHLWEEESFDEDYDALIRQEQTRAAGVPVLTAPCLIALEAKTWMDLTDRKEAGEEIKSRQIGRHKDTVFRMTALLPGGEKEPVQVPERVRTDMMEFLKRMESESVSLRRLGIIGITREEVTEELREVFADGNE